ncbi:unnamed protein product, partial [Didymodactylos carnosus]
MLPQKDNQSLTYGDAVNNDPKRSTAVSNNAKDKHLTEEHSAHVAKRTRRPKTKHHSKMIKWLTMTFHELDRHFARFGVHHRHIVSCIHLCSTAFITDGFQKPIIYICSNHNRGVVSEELGFIQLGCANRPAAKPRQRTNPKDVYSERSQGEPPTCQEWRDIG